MTDVRRLLDQATRAPAPVPSHVVEADLARAQRGLRRHRASWCIRSGVVAAAACAAAVMVVQPGSPSGSTTDSTSGPLLSRQESSIALVAYTGPPVAGFTIDRVPAGWVVEAVDDSALTLVPAGQQDPDGYRKLEVDGLRALHGRIAVFLSDRLPQRIGTTVEVNGSRGLVVALDDGAAGDRLGGYSLFLPQTGDYLTIQVPAELNWSVRRLVEFTAGIHARDDALTSGG